MRLLSVYVSDDIEESKTAKVYIKMDDESKYHVVVRSDSGTHYSTTFKTIESAENFAEDWVRL